MLYSCLLDPYPIKYRDPQLLEFEIKSLIILYLAFHCLLNICHSQIGPKAAIYVNENPIKDKGNLNNLRENKQMPVKAKWGLKML